MFPTDFSSQSICQGGKYGAQQIAHGGPDHDLYEINMEDAHRIETRKSASEDARDAPARTAPEDWPEHWVKEWIREHSELKGRTLVYDGRRKTEQEKDACQKENALHRCGT